MRYENGMEVTGRREETSEKKKGDKEGELRKRINKNKVYGKMP